MGELVILEEYRVQLEEQKKREEEELEMLKEEELEMLKEEIACLMSEMEDRNDFTPFYNLYDTNGPYFSPFLFSSIFFSYYNNNDDDKK